MAKITNELRESMIPCISDDWLTITKSAFECAADRIDAEYETTELQKESYRIDLKAANIAVGEAYKRGFDESFASADDWLGQHEDAMAEHGWVKLPTDADGVPIHVGDVMECGDGTVFTVENITLYTFGWRCDGDGIDGNGYKCTAHPIPDCCRHHKPTIKDVFMEFAYKILNHDQTDAISHRIKRYAEEYADKMCAIIEGSKGPEWQETASQDEGR